MSRIAIVVSVLVLAFAIGTVAQATPFEVPPDHPVDGVPGWVTQYPYQRNIDLTFDVDPEAPAGNGIPGAIYDGYDDPSLLDTDFVLFGGDAGWVPGIDLTPYNLGVYTGLVGMVNQTANPISGEVIVHVDNWPDPQLEKHVWIEFDVIASSPDVIGDVQMEIVPSIGMVVAGGDNDLRQLPSGLFRQNAWVTIRPNPEWEELRLSITDLGSGEFILLDRVHIATECVPEPGTLALGVLAMFGLAAFARRRRV